MTDIKLAAFTFNGTRYEGVSMTVDEAKNEAELSSEQKSLLRKRMVPLTKLTYDSKTKVVVDGKFVSVNDLRLEAASEEEARSLASVLGKPAADARRRLEDGIRGMEGSIEKFLDARGDAIGFLAGYKSNPRKAILALPSTMLGGDPSGDPSSLVLKAYSERLSHMLEELNAALRDGEGAVGSKVADRLYALAYAIGAEQDAILEGNKDKSERVKLFLTELGARGEIGADTGLAGLPKRVLEDARPGLLSLSGEGQ